jgi:hypothetical protein
MPSDGEFGGDGGVEDDESAGPGNTGRRVDRPQPSLGAISGLGDDRLDGILAVHAGRCPRR